MSLPPTLRIDVSTSCQLKCAACPTGSGKTHQTLGNGRMSLKDFQLLVERNPRIKHIEIANWGEIFLNKDLAAIVEYAAVNGVKLHADIGVNLNYAAPGVLETMVRYGFASMTCAIDGASDATYKQNRIGGNYQQVLSYIAQINAFKKKYKTSLPKLTWQFIIFENNTHEVKEAKKKARALEMAFYTLDSWDSLDLHVGRTDATNKKPRDIRLHRKYQKPDISYNTCVQLWNQPKINWDGRVSGCCANYWDDFGNALQTDLAEIMKGDRYRYAQDMLPRHET